MPITDTAFARAARESLAIMARYAHVADPAERLRLIAVALHDSGVDVVGATKLAMSDPARANALRVAAIEQTETKS